MTPVPECVGHPINNDYARPRCSTCETWWPCHVAELTDQVKTLEAREERYCRALAVIDGDNTGARWREYQLSRAGSNLTVTRVSWQKLRRRTWTYVL